MSENLEKLADDVLSDPSLYGERGLRRGFVAKFRELLITERTEIVGALELLREGALPTRGKAISDCISAVKSRTKKM